MFNQISLYAMAMLLGWGIANLGIGIWRQWHPSSTKRYFWQMNAAWGFINAVIAGLALRSLSLNFIRGETDVAYQNSQINIIFFNIFLDIIYVVVGILLCKLKVKTRSKRRYAYGWAVIVQGGFLLIFDVVLWVLLKTAI